MRGVRHARWLTAAAVTALLATACGPGPDGGAGAAGKDGGTFRFGVTEPKAIDPALASETTGLIVSEVVFTGLYRTAPDGKLEPRLAESATANDTCTEWTFKVRTGTTFTNGEPVDAEAFIRGWNRATSKPMASDIAYHLAGIKGFDEIQDGKADKLAGLSSTGPDHLKVELSSGDCEFDKKTGHTVFSPMPKAAGGPENKEFADQPIGNGPFKLDGKWDHNKKISLVRNDGYGLKPAKLARVEISLVNYFSMFDLEYQGFQTGEFDYAHVPTTQLTAAEARYKPQGKWLHKDVNGQNYLLPITDQGPLKTKEARLAVSYAIDRAKIAKSLYQGYQKPASSIVPPALPDSYQEGLCASCLAPDPAKARELAKAGGLTPGTRLTLAFNTGVGHEDWIQAVGKQLEDVLGIVVEVKGLPFPELLEKEHAPDATGLFRYSWGADYPTPDNYLFPMLHSSSIAKEDNGTVGGDNTGRYSNPEFDKVIEQARATKDEAARIALYKQAEKIAMDDMALIPTFNRSEYRLVATDKFDGLDDIGFGETPVLEEISLKRK
ncbi:ABC transporter substrate-binding protein [Streptomyces sp. NPDC090022]|uniref:peptide ABC transporter substrate-binding protein n=1 Tax=Streptomyces sp. NPDC090022 TaxID=3365920 RepID=UPI0037F810C4